jgi:hypothetical protein
MAQRHAADQVLLEPLERLAGGQLVDRGRRDAAVTSTSTSALFSASPSDGIVEEVIDQPSING